MKVFILDIREKKNITLNQLEELSGIGKTTLNNIETGKVSPRLDQLESIAWALGVSINDLFESEIQYHNYNK